MVSLQVLRNFGRDGVTAGMGAAFGAHIVETIFYDQVGAVFKIGVQKIEAVLQVTGIGTALGTLRGDTVTLFCTVRPSTAAIDLSHDISSIRSVPLGGGRNCKWHTNNIYL